jgi:hypothetical protein
LNWALERIDAPRVAFLSGHAVPENDHWLGRLVEPLQSADVAGAFGRQLPHPGCFPLEAEDIARTYPSGDRSPTIYFSNANSAIRVAAWRHQVFDEIVTSGEDGIWASLMMSRGWRIAYVPSAAVFHSHNDNFRQRYWRVRREVGPLAASLPEYSVRYAALRVPASALLSIARDFGRAARGAISPNVALRAVPYRIATAIGRLRGQFDAARLRQQDRAVPPRK